jgi:hypothetical protein
MAEPLIAEAVEVISVVRIGISLVDYTYKVFSNIFEDSDISEITGRLYRSCGLQAIKYCMNSPLARWLMPALPND